MSLQDDLDQGFVDLGPEPQQSTWDKMKAGAAKWLKSDSAKNVARIGLAKHLNNIGFTDEEIKRSGYQGGIPNYTAVRERVDLDPVTAGSYLPGAMGRRYMSDTRYITDAGGASGIEATPQRLYGQVFDETGADTTDYTTLQRFTDDTVDETQNYDDAAQAAYLEDNPDAEFTDAGYLITEKGTKQLGQDYTDEGYHIKDKAMDFTNLDVARGIGAEQARGFAEDIQTSPYGGSAFNFAAGGIAQLAGGRYLDGMTDGMADKVPANIDGTQPAALSDGEFVIPADVVSHLGNGSSNAGAKVLDNMMTNVRKERTGNPNQGKQINPKQVMAKGGLAGYAHGGPVQKFQDGGLAAEPIDIAPVYTAADGPATNPVENTTTQPKTDPAAPTGQGSATDDIEDDSGLGKMTGGESSLSNWVGETVTGMIGKGDALLDRGYEAYTGPLTAGIGDTQQAAFDAAQNIDTSGAGLGSFGNLAQTTTYNEDGSVNVMGRDAYMNPYLEQSLAPQLRIAQEEADRQMAEQNIRAAQSGSFGGSRNAIMNAMLQRDSAQQQADITAQGYDKAYQDATSRFGEDRTFGLDALRQQADLGKEERDIYSESVAAAKEQFEQERDFDWNSLQYMNSLLQGMPIAAQNYEFSQPSDYQDIANMFQRLGGTDGLTDVVDSLINAGVDYGTDTVSNWINSGLGSFMGGGDTQAEPDVGDVSANSYNDGGDDFLNFDDVSNIA